MLEIASLVIYPWQHAEADGWSRAVADGATAAPLGRVRWRGRAEPGWLDWLRGQRMDMLETEDAALLMTLVRSWGLTRCWDLYDAEDRRVGTLAPPLLLDNEGGRRAYLDRADRDHGRLVNPLSRVLADYARQSDGVMQFRFAADLEPNPFLRMLLLGCVLIEEVPPAKWADRKRRHMR
jgi:hypothetical protein